MLWPESPTHRTPRDGAHLTAKVTLRLALVSRAMPRIWVGLLAVFAAQADREDCQAAFDAQLHHYRDLSAVMAQEHNWDILHRRGEPLVCLEENHRFFFALFFYQQWGAAAATADFAACLPKECDAEYLPEDLLPKMYQHFFEYHMHFLEDGRPDESKSLQYSITVKEYKSSMVFSEFQWPLLLGAVIALLPCCLVTLLWDLPLLWKPAKSPAPLLVHSFSILEGWKELVSVNGLSSDLCWIRVCYVIGLILLHVTQGSKWRGIEVLESSYIIFAAVRPLALVNDAFIQLSTYLCACSDAKATGTTWERLRSGLRRSSKKYLRQLPVCLFWSWFYLCVLPSVPYNPYNHAFPWFGIRWYHATAKCMKRKWRYSFLLGDLGALLLQDGDDDWHTSNGNPCVNLWNFQLEIQAFTLTTCCLALGRRSALSIFVAVVALGFGTTSYAHAWWLHHARGIALQMLFIIVFGLACKPLASKWRPIRWLGAFCLLIALFIHGVARGGWSEKSSLIRHLSSVLQDVLQNKLLATGLWQAVLALGTVLLCEGSRAGPPATAWLAAANRLAFGMNVAHPFVQFFVEAHSTLNDRVFSLFSWPTHLALTFALTALPATLVYLLVQRPWALLLQHIFEIFSAASKAQKALDEKD